MYNRYIRNDNGVYTRIPEDASPRSDGSQRSGSPPQGSRPSDQRQNGSRQSRERDEHQRPSSREEPRQDSRPGGENTWHAQQEEPQPFPFFAKEEGEGIRHTLRKLLDRFHLDHVDTGDLLLLVLIFFLLQEDTDEELLIALGLLLIL